MHHDLSQANGGQKACVGLLLLQVTLAAEAGRLVADPLMFPGNNSNGLLSGACIGAQPDLLKVATGATDGEGTFKEPIGVRAGLVMLPPLATRTAAGLRLPPPLRPDGDDWCTPCAAVWRTCKRIKAEVKREGLRSRTGRMSESKRKFAASEYPASTA